MKSICKTQFRNLTIGNRYGSFPKRFTRKSPRIISIRGFFRRNYVLQMKSICKTQCRNLTIDNRFTRQSPLMVSIHGLYRRNDGEAK